MNDTNKAELALEQGHVILPLRQSQRSLAYLAKRVAFLMLYAVNMATLGLFVYLVAPVTSLLAFNDIRFWRHIHQFHKLSYRMFTHTIALITNPTYSRAFRLAWLDAPRDAPDRSEVEVKQAWKLEHGESCDGCVHCCERIGCNLIDHERGGCMLYGSFFWRYFTCGPFPQNQFQIDYYQCPKWKAR